MIQKALTEIRCKYYLRTETRELQIRNHKNLRPKKLEYPIGEALLTDVDINDEIVLFSKST